MPMPPKIRALAPFGLVVLAVLATIGCEPRAREAEAMWKGSVDTLATGKIIVHNTDDPIWPEGREWRVIEELRIGTVEGAGPDLFGAITWLELDPLGRIWVLEGQAQEVRVFEADGSHVRTIGRKGGGPGEFAQALHIQLGPDGHMWVADPQNNRFSVIDTAGVFVEGKRAPGGFTIQPWPGGFDAAGFYYSPVPRFGQDDPFRLGLVRLDAGFEPVDTLVTPSLLEPERFELRTEDRYAAMGVPFTGSFRWRLAPSGRFWGLFTADYRLVELSPDGDTLRTITRDFSPVPVTGADREDAREELEWFIQEGGKVDWSRIPDTKPAAEDFYLDDRGNVWVLPVMPRDQEWRALDVFDPEGRYLGRVELPFPLHGRPVIRGDVLLAVTQDELEVPYVVRARIERL